MLHSMSFSPANHSNVPSAIIPSTINDWEPCHISIAGAKTKVIIDTDNQQSKLDSLNDNVFSCLNDPRFQISPDKTFMSQEERFNKLSSTRSSLSMKIDDQFHAFESYSSSICASLPTSCHNQPATMYPQLRVPIFAHSSASYPSVDPPPRPSSSLLSVHSDDQVSYCCEPVPSLDLRDPHDVISVLKVYQATKVTAADDVDCSIEMKMNESNQHSPWEHLSINNTEASDELIPNPVNYDTSRRCCWELALGTRIEIYWDGEGEYFSGTLTKKNERNNRGDCFFIQYDDGDEEWVHLDREIYRFVLETPDQASIQEKKACNSSSHFPVKKNRTRKRRKDVTVYSSNENVCAELTPSVRHEASNVADQDNWVTAGVPKRSQEDSSDSETDDEEVMNWAVQMLGVSPRPITISGNSKSSAPSVQNHLLEARTIPDWDEEETCMQRRKAEAKPLSRAEIKSFLSHDLIETATSDHWVRRSTRQPSRQVLDSPQVRALIDKLKSNDTDMVVLKMKKYVNDPNAPQLVFNAVLDALEDNTNCESLYIQNFNEGMRDEQVLRLINILKRPLSKIWCLNIGETYKVKAKTWNKFADGLEDTKITHMYASEHTITPDLKDQIRCTIRRNRSKHTMHCDPENLDTIIQCTHCWWNPINTHSLRPYLKYKGIESILNDKDRQGLRGTRTGADLS